jgi:hypothetical protein
MRFNANSMDENLLLVKLKEKNLLKIQPLPTVLRMQAIRSKQLESEHMLIHIHPCIRTKDVTPYI